MKPKHDKIADAIYIKLSNKPYAYGTDLDDLRRIDYDSDGNSRGVELLCVSEGVNLEDLPQIGEIAEALEAKGIKVYVVEPPPSITWQSYSGVLDLQDYRNMFNVTEGTGKLLVKETEEITV